MKELIMRWKVMKLDLQRQVGLLMEGRLTTGTNNRDTTEETVERVGRMIDQLDSLLKEHDRPAPEARSRSAKHGPTASRSAPCNLACGHPHAQHINDGLRMGAGAGPFDTHPLRFVPDRRYPLRQDP